MAYIEFKDVIKAYGEGDARIHALDGASFYGRARRARHHFWGASGCRAKDPTGPSTFWGGMGHGNFWHRDGGRA
mgnify:CR=1 FL=1